MTRIVVTSRVDENGVLHLSLPLSKEDANKLVRVTVEPLKGANMTQEEWRRWVEQTAGTWQGEFERPPQGEFEKRDELP
jgi:hypothetical protein